MVRPGVLNSTANYSTVEPPAKTAPPVKIALDAGTTVEYGTNASVK